MNTMTSTTERPPHSTASLSQARIESPLGAILAVFADDALIGLDFVEGGMQPGATRLARLLARGFGPISFAGPSAIAEADVRADAVRASLGEYLAGRLDAFDGVRVRTAGTAFQERVWAALRGLAPGETVSYGTLAVRIGSPRAVRAVGLANAMNPIPLVIPCHRVIGSDGALTGYAGGVERKRWLIAHEAASAGIGRNAGTHRRASTRDRACLLAPAPAG